MRQYKQHEEEEKLKFARKAGKWFSENEHGKTYTIGDVEGGALFAVRWGLGKDCVLVFRIDEFEDIIIYPQFIDKELKQ